jgi:hypothetical protein
MSFTRTLALLAATSLIAVRLAATASAQPAEFLEARHAAYEEIEALAARGHLDSLRIYTRPLARLDLARALLRERVIRPEVERDPAFARLERELARELQDLDSSRAYPESGPLVDSGPRETRFRLQSAAHVRGDYDETRDDALFRFRDETSVGVRMALQVWPALVAYEEIAVTRIRGQREWIDPLASDTDAEFAVLHAGLTARGGPVTGSIGYDYFRWGPGRRGTLLLSEAAGPMGFLQLRGDFAGKISVTALSGVLSREEDRMLAAHRIEFAATRWLTLGLAEAARYSSDGIDLLYGIGLLPYSLVERIHVREVSADSLRGDVRSNVMASADMVVRVSPDLTLYGEVLVDDFTTEEEQMPDRFGWQAGFRSHRPLGSGAIRFLGEYTFVRNYTYSVDYGKNYEYRGKPLGYALGPDAENVFLETAYDLSRDWQVRWSGDFTNKGEGRIGEAWTPDLGDVDNSRPMGVVERRREVWGDVRWLPRDNVDLAAGLGFRRRENVDHVSGVDETAWLARFAAELRY